MDWVASTLHTTSEHVVSSAKVSRYTAQQGDPQPVSTEHRRLTHTTQDMLPQHQINITKQITECFKL